MHVRIYATLRPLVGGASAIELVAGPGDTVRAALDELTTRWPQLRAELFDAQGSLSGRIHVFLNGRDVRYLAGLDMPIPPHADLRIFPPVGGGA
ncbi:MAG: MoaD family protein [Caldilineales bacterium]|nr:MoaD family protein [Caldilineales bacterium]